MKVNNQVHLIRKEFFVTPEVKRYVNIYLIVGRYCYLIDSGVAGTEELIGQYLATIHHKMSDIKGIFLTHSHPDHIGAATEIKKQTNCQIYAPVEELLWIEDIQQQFSQRPIPNFFKLLSQSVDVNHPLKNGDVLVPEEGITIRAVSTKGHSHGSMSYILNDEVIFTGDAIPVAGELPIFTDYDQTVKSLDIIKGLEGIKYYCPAWDDIYDKDRLDMVVEDSKKMLSKMKKDAFGVQKKYAGNPLFAESIEACRRAGQ